MSVLFIPIVEPTPYRCTAIRLNRAVVAKHWRDIERHKWLLREHLERDVGMRVAALDYVENIYPTEPWPSLAERLKSYFKQLPSRMLSRAYADGPASLVRFERAMQGTRSLAK